MARSTAGTRLVAGALTLAVLLAVSVGVARAYEDESGRTEGVVAQRSYDSPNQYNSDYIFAATRGVSEMNVHPALKITIIPVTLVLDVVFLPFAVIAGFFG
jgi:uncharacterized protein YceK